MSTIAKPSRDIFDHLVRGLRFKQAPSNVRRAIRLWVFSEYLPVQDRFELSDDELEIVNSYPQFKDYVASELETYLNGNQIILVCLAIAWEQEQQQGTATEFDIPWFLRLPEHELAANREEYQATRPEINALRTEKSVHTRANVAIDSIHLTTPNYDDGKQNIMDCGV